MKQNCISSIGTQPQNNKETKDFIQNFPKHVIVPRDFSCWLPVLFPMHSASEELHSPVQEHSNQTQIDWFLE